MTAGERLTATSGGAGQTTELAPLAPPFPDYLLPPYLPTNGSQQAVKHWANDNDERRLY